MCLSITIVGVLLAIGWLKLISSWSAIQAAYWFSMLLVAVGQEVLNKICLILDACLLEVARLLRVLWDMLLWISRCIISFEDLARVTHGLLITILFAALSRVVYQKALRDGKVSAVLLHPQC